VEDDLEAHFVSVQRICHNTALPAVVPRLKHAMQSHLDLDAQLRVLRGSVSSHQKLQAWEDLKILAFTRAAAATISLTILSLHMRVTLNILSRQLYLDLGLQGTPGRTEWPTLGVEAQESFLALVEKGFASVGVGHLVRVVQAVVSRRVGELQLSKSLSAPELRAVLEGIRDELFPTVIHGGWVTAERTTGGVHLDGQPGGDGDGGLNVISARSESSSLAEFSVPPPHDGTNCRWDDLLMPPHNMDLLMGVVPEAAGSRVGVGEAQRFETEQQLLSMAREVRTTVGDQRFVDVLEAALNEAWEQMTVEALKEVFGVDMNPLDGGTVIQVAKLVPAMSNLSGEILEEASSFRGVLGVVSGCREVHAFMREIW